MLARLHARLPGGLGKDWFLEKDLGVELGKSAGKFCWVGGAWEKCLRGCMQGCWATWAGTGAWKLPRVDARKFLEILLRLFQYHISCYVSLEVCLGCSYQKVLGESSSNNTTAHHHVEAIVVSMGQLKKSVVKTTEEM